MTFAARRTELLARAAEADLLKASAVAGTRPRTAVFGQFGRVAAGQPVDDDVIDETVAILTDRIDCADFTVAGILRLLTFELPHDQRAKLTTAVRDFKYWWHEPGKDGMCYHTENHQILFHSAELLAGESALDDVLSNSGRTGRALTDHALPLVRQWLRLRSQVGWSEWLSNTYLEHNLLALLNLHDLAADPEIRRTAAALADVLLVELALHTHHGVFGSTHGRAYARGLVDGFDDGTATLSWLLFGTGHPHDPGSVGALTLAISNYTPPAIVFELARGPQGSAETIRQRMSFEVDAAGQLGLGYESEEHAHVYWAMQEFMHPKVLPLTQHLLASYELGLDTDPAPYELEYRRQRETSGRITDPWRDRHALSEVNVLTHRTEHAMLSTAQSYRPGRPGYQHHIWQATLGPRAVVFTNHPGSEDLTSRPNWLAGNAVLPRAAQHEAVTICLHRIPADDPFPFSHAYFPTTEFDETRRAGNWHTARKGKGFVALWCSQSALGQPNEIRSAGNDAAWICEIADTSSYADLDAFTASLSNATTTWTDGHLEYTSPRYDVVEFSWDGPLVVAGRPVGLTAYPRLDSPYGRVELGEETWSLSAGGVATTITTALRHSGADSGRAEEQTQ
jgi:hypothetical protein